MTRKFSLHINWDDDGYAVTLADETGQDEIVEQLTGTLQEARRAAWVIESLVRCKGYEVVGYNLDATEAELVDPGPVIPW
jgi:hypothetical protein